MSGTRIAGVRPGAPLPAVVNANTGNAQVFADAGVSATAALTLPLLGSGRLASRKFRVRASGFATTAGAFTVLATLAYAAVIPATPLTLANWTTLGASTARAVGTTTAPWWIEAVLEFDFTSLLIQGVFEAMINNLYNAYAAVTNALAITNTEPVAYFAAAITFGTANAGNSASLVDFGIDLA